MCFVGDLKHQWLKDREVINHFHERNVSEESCEVISSFFYFVKKGTLKSLFPDGQNVYQV